MTDKKIVLLHGWEARKEKLAPLAKSLQECGWQVMNLSLPGFDAPAPSFPWDVTDYAEYALAKAEKKLGRGFIIFGHSFGGRVAIRAALQDKNNNVKGLVLCGAAGFSRPSWLKRALFWFLAKVGKIFASLLPQGEKWSRRLFYKIVGEHDYEKTSGVMKETFKKVVADDLSEAIVKVTSPVLLLWGAKDRLTPLADLRFIQNVRPEAEVKIFAKADHLLPYRQSDKLALEIDQWWPC